MNKKMNSKNDVVKVLKKSMRLKVMMLLAVMLTFNTFAWFIYSTSVSNSITTSVKAWKIEFESEYEIIEYIKFDLDDLYPGMPEYTNFINIVNYGDTGANVTYEIVSLKVLEDLYESPTYTSEDLEYMLNNDYPFLIEFSLSDPYLVPEVGSCDFIIDATWDYEGGDDAVDTTWGHDSYNFKQLYPLEKQIIINVKLTATQAN